MGEQKVSLLTDQKQMQRFVKLLLDDVKALEFMLENDWFESGITRIGAEQEMCIVDLPSYKAAPIAMEALDSMKEYEWVETELARFNLETNLTPRELEGSCLSDMEKENNHNLNKIREKLALLDSKLILTGILPTLRKFDLNMDNLTPKKRYKALMEAINEQLIASAYELRLTGIDELLIKHDSPLLEACNTSFQVHLQIEPKDFVKMYNIAQTLAAPVMAIAANSPIVFGKRLWHESRIAMFQQSLDTRTTHDHMRERSPRVSFGKDWLKDSILEIYKEDIARFRVLISADVEEDALEMIQNDKTPKLRALQVHNSTVYRWNRPCYGISENGKPHLRIENRVLASGPTVLDEMANTAFWIGLMVGMDDQYEDIREHISFADVRDNFSKAAQFGIDSKFTWFNDEKITACDLVKDQLIPIARAGLEKRGVDTADIDRYLDVIQGRAENHMNGARWSLRAYTKLIEEVSVDEALTVLTAATIKNQEQEIPVHLWPMPELSDLEEYKPTDLTVSEFMSTDLITVQKDDIVELVAGMMDWKNIRYIPVEDSKGNFVGLLSPTIMLKEILSKSVKEKEEGISVQDVMIKEPFVVQPETDILSAMNLMQKEGVGCLPVVKNDELIGLITEAHFVAIANRLFKRLKN